MSHDKGESFFWLALIEEGSIFEIAFIGNFHFFGHSFSRKPPSRNIVSPQNA